MYLFSFCGRGNCRMYGQIEPSWCTLKSDSLIEIRQQSLNVRFSFASSKYDWILFTSVSSLGCLVTHLRPMCLSVFNSLSLFLNRSSRLCVLSQSAVCCGFLSPETGQFYSMLYPISFQTVCLLWGNVVNYWKYYSLVTIILIWRTIPPYLR